MVVRLERNPQPTPERLGACAQRAGARVDQRAITLGPLLPAGSSHPARKPLTDIYKYIGSPHILVYKKFFLKIFRLDQNRLSVSRETNRVQKKFFKIFCGLK